jgi:hypothetical protein
LIDDIPIASDDPQPQPTPGAIDRELTREGELTRERAIKLAEQQRAATDAAVRIEALKQRINRLQRAVRLAIESELADWTGRTYGSLTANQDVVRMIHDMIDGHGLRLKCPECGHPAILRCSSRPGIADGVFVFDHQIDGRRTFHGGGVVMPALRLVAKPPRRRKVDPT